MKLVIHVPCLVGPYIPFRYYLKPSVFLDKIKIISKEQKMCNSDAMPPLINPKLPSSNGGAS